MQKTLIQIEKSYAKSIASSLWELHEGHMQTQLDGILNIPGIQYACILDKDKMIVESGKKNNGKVIERSIPLEHLDSKGQTTLIGHLMVYANAANVYQKLYKRFYLIFITQMFKTILVSFLIYLSIQELLTRHLISISHYLKDVKMDSLDVNLRIKRKKDDSEDELDSLVKSINEMRIKLVDSYKELSDMNRLLEENVENKTHQILEQRQKLEHASKMSILGEMAGGIAHEINNPMTIISSTARILRKLAEKKDFEREEFLKHCDVIDKTVQRITKITTGMQVVSRDASDEDFSICKISDLFDDVLALCGEKFKVNGVDVFIDLNKDQYKNTIKCNRVELSQVFLNLLANAFDAVMELPEKWVRIECQERSQGEGRELVLHFIDSGKGIKKDVQEKIFRPFFTMKEVGKGVGIGLSLAKTIIKNHHGDMYVEDTYKNTCFVIILPIYGAKNA